MRRRLGLLPVSGGRDESRIGPVTIYPSVLTPGPGDGGFGVVPPQVVPSLPSRCVVEVSPFEPHNLLARSANKKQRHRVLEKSVNKNKTSIINYSIKI